MRVCVGTSWRELARTGVDRTEKGALCVPLFQYVPWSFLGKARFG